MIVAVVMTYNMVKQKSVKQLMLVVMGALIGISIVSFPQCAINRQYVGEFSPKVYTEAYTNYNSDLQATQVLWGLSYPRYESYAGDMDKYESASVYFDDIVGNRIIVEEGISAETFKLATILRIFIKYPLDTIGIYTRHLISIATPAWNQAYITNIYTNKIFIVLLSIALWLLGGLNVFANLNRNSFQSANAGFVVSICVPPFLQLFGAPELRFFLPVYILLYVYVFLEIDFLEIAMYIKHRWLSIVVTMLFIIILWLTVFGDILALNREIPLLINDICR